MRHPGSPARTFRSGPGLTLIGPIVNATEGLQSRSHRGVCLPLTAAIRRSTTMIATDAGTCASVLRPQDSGQLYDFSPSAADKRKNDREFRKPCRGFCLG